MKIRIQLRASDSSPFETLFGPGGTRGFRPNFPAAAGSLALHSMAVLLLAFLSAPSLPRPVNFQVTMLPLKDRIIWYTPQEHLPQVAATEHPDARPVKVTRIQPGQSISANLPKAPEGRQFIWQPPPKITLQSEVRSPNVLAFNPKPPPPKTFVQPANSKPPEPAQIVLPDAAPIAMPLANTAVPVLGAITASPKLLVRQFTAPPAAAGTATARAVALDSAPSLQPASDLPKLAVIGLDPAQTADIPLPEGSRPSRFSSGPKSSDSGEGRSAAIVVPGLSINGGPPSPEGVTVKPRKPAGPYQEPTPPEWAKAVSGKDSRRLARSMSSVPLRPGARVVSPSVESQFTNRLVYTTSFEVGPQASSQWVIWFSEKGGVPSQYATIRPPVPWTRDGDWTAVAGLPARIQLAAVIDREGRPASVSVLRCSNENLRGEAVQVIERLEFLPALRNGEPVPVDVLIEITAAQGR